MNVTIERLRTDLSESVPYRLRTSSWPAAAARLSALLLILQLTGCDSAPDPYDYAPFLDDPFEPFGPALTLIRIFFTLGGLAMLVAGYKLYRFVIALPGLLIGAVLGGALGAANDSALLAFLGLIIGGILGVFLALLLHDLAVFIIGAIAGAALFGGFVGLFTGDVPPALILIVGGLLGGVALLALSHLWIMALSSTVGALLFGLGIGADLGWMILFFFLGMAVQYGLARALGESVPVPKLGRKEEPAVVPESATPGTDQSRAILPGDQPAESGDHGPDATLGQQGGTVAKTVNLEEQTAIIPMATLVRPNGQSFAVHDGFQIGRSAANDLRLPDPSVSRRHARLRYGGGFWYLQDLNSTHGSYVDGRRVTAVKLKPGSRIQIGDDAFTFYPGKELPERKQ